MGCIFTKCVEHKCDTCNNIKIKRTLETLPPRHVWTCLYCESGGRIKPCPNCGHRTEQSNQMILKCRNCNTYV